MTSKSKMWSEPRDPDRIPEVLALLEERWRAVPDQRLGQVLVNLVRRELGPEPAREGEAIFALEDGRWIELLSPDKMSGC